MQLPLNWRNTMSTRTKFESDWQHLNPNQNFSVIGIYDSKSSSENGISKLKKQGFEAEEISMLIPDKTISEEESFELKSKTPIGAATGAIAGAVIIGAIGWLIGIGAFSINETEPFLASGAIISAIAGAGIGGIIGGISGALIAFGISELEDRKYKRLAQSAGIVLSVHCKDSDWSNQAKKLLEVTGAHDIASIAG